MGRRSIQNRFHNIASFQTIGSKRRIIGSILLVVSSSCLLIVILSFIVGRHQPPRLQHAVAEAKSDYRPAVIFLHGYGSNEQDLFSLRKYFPQEWNFFSPRAPITLRKGSYAWYNLTWKEGRVVGMDTSGAQNLVPQLDQYLTRLQNEYAIDKDSIFLIGFSQGAISTMDYCYHGNTRILKGAVLSGRIPVNDTFESTNSQLFVSHGLNDPIIPIEEGRKIKRIIDKTSTAKEYHEYNMAHQISQPCLKDLQRFIQD